MNYLGHSLLAYLPSGFEQGLAVGHFIADFIKGNAAFLTLPQPVQLGVQMHRATDAFTDQHGASRRMASRLQPNFGKYAPVIVDVVYDHFLCKHWANYCSWPLAQHAKGYYAILHTHTHLMPERAASVLKHMSRDNWLVHYGSEKGLWLSLNGLARRSSAGKHIPEAAELVLAQSESFQSDFEAFMSDLLIFKANWLTNNLAI